MPNSCPIGSDLFSFRYPAACSGWECNPGHSMATQGLRYPAACCVGASFFETHDAFVHIDIKTSRVDNPSDYKGIVPLGKNQTSYKATQSITGMPIQTEPNLPRYYTIDGNEKPCLTYTIQIIHIDW